MILEDEKENPTATGIPIQQYDEGGSMTKESKYVADSHKTSCPHICQFRII